MWSGKDDMEPSPALPLEDLSAGSSKDDKMRSLSGHGSQVNKVGVYDDSLKSAISIYFSHWARPGRCLKVPEVLVKDSPDIHMAATTLLLMMILMKVRKKSIAIIFAKLDTLPSQNHPHLYISSVPWMYPIVVPFFGREAFVRKKKMGIVYLFY